MQRVPRFAIAAPVCLVLTLAITPATASSQGVLGRLKKKTEEAVREKIDKRAAAAADSAVNKVDCSVPGNQCDPVTATTEATESAAEAEPATVSSQSAESSGSGDNMVHSSAGYGVDRDGVTYRLTDAVLPRFAVVLHKVAALRQSKPSIFQNTKKNEVHPELKALYTQHQDYRGGMEPVFHRDNGRDHGRRWSARSGRRDS